MAPTAVSTESLILRIKAVDRSDDEGSGTTYSALARFVRTLDLALGTAWELGNPALLRRIADRTDDRSPPPRPTYGDAHDVLYGRYLRATGDTFLGFGPGAPRVVRLQMASPLELTMLLPPALAAGAGVISVFLHLIERMFTVKARIAAENERYRAERAEWEARRTRVELYLLDSVARAIARGDRIEEPGPSSLHVVEVELDDAGA